MDTAVQGVGTDLVYLPWRYTREITVRWVGCVTTLAPLDVCLDLAVVAGYGRVSGVDKNGGNPQHEDEFYVSLHIWYWRGVMLVQAHVSRQGMLTFVLY